MSARSCCSWIILIPIISLVNCDRKENKIINNKEDVSINSLCESIIKNRIIRIDEMDKIIDAIEESSKPEEIYILLDTITNAAFNGEPPSKFYLVISSLLVNKDSDIRDQALQCLLSKRKSKIVINKIEEALNLGNVNPLLLDYLSNINNIKIEDFKDINNFYKLLDSNNPEIIRSSIRLFANSGIGNEAILRRVCDLLDIENEPSDIVMLVRSIVKLLEYDIIYSQNALRKCFNKHQLVQIRIEVSLALLNFNDHEEAKKYLITWINDGENNIRARRAIAEAALKILPEMSSNISTDVLTRNE